MSSYKNKANWKKLLANKDFALQINLDTQPKSPKLNKGKIEL